MLPGGRLVSALVRTRGSLRIAATPEIPQVVQHQQRLQSLRDGGQGLAAFFKNPGELNSVGLWSARAAWRWQPLSTQRQRQPAGPNPAWAGPGGNEPWATGPIDLREPGLAAPAEGSLGRPAMGRPVAEGQWTDARKPDRPQAQSTSRRTQQYITHRLQRNPRTSVHVLTAFGTDKAPVELGCRPSNLAQVPPLAVLLIFWWACSASLQNDEPLEPLLRGPGPGFGTRPRSAPA